MAVEDYVAADMAGYADEADDVAGADVAELMMWQVTWQELLMCQVPRMR